MNTENIDEILRDPVGNAIRIAQDIIYAMDHNLNDEVVLEVLDRYALLQILAHNHWSTVLPDITPSQRDQALATIYQSCNNLQNALKELRQGNVFLAAKERYSAAIGTVPHYELTDGDVNKLQKLINELRQAISSSDPLSEDHKRRLLSRLERVQSELHKRMSDYDRAYGIIFDGIVLAHQFGKSVEPITQLIKEIGNIFFKSHARAAELPSDAKLQLPDID